MKKKEQSTSCSNEKQTNNNKDSIDLNEIVFCHFFVCVVVVWNDR